MNNYEEGSKVEHDDKDTVVKTGETSSSEFHIRGITDEGRLRALIALAGIGCVAILVEKVFFSKEEDDKSIKTPLYNVAENEKHR